jgi:glycosyltransferase involved in cell wall biosynthesis
MKLTVFPNWAAQRLNGGFSLEASHPLLLDRLAERLGEVVLAAPVHSGEARGNYAPLVNPRVRFLSLGEVDVGRPKWARALGYIALLPRAWRAMREADFCYVFVPGHVGLVVALLCRATGKPYALYFRGDWARETPRWARGLGGWLFRGADFILSTGKELATEMRRFAPRSEAVVPMSLLLHRYAYPEPAELRPEAGATLLFVGEIVRAKGVFDLVEVVARLRATHELDVRLILVGAGADRPGLEDLVRAKNLTGFVHFLGSVSDPARLRDIYRESDVFCLPTYGEGFPRVIYEAMTFSLPVLTTPVGQIPRVVEDGRNGLLHPPGDVAALESCLARVVSDASFRSRLGEAGRATIEPMAASWRNASHGDQVLKWLATERRA